MVTYMMLNCIFGRSLRVSFGHCQSAVCYETTTIQKLRNSVKGGKKPISWEPLAEGRSRTAPANRYRRIGVFLSSPEDEERSILRIVFF
jgi:hypothetical protein